MSSTIFFLPCPLQSFYNHFPNPQKVLFRQGTERLLSTAGVLFQCEPHQYPYFLGDFSDGDTAVDRYQPDGMNYDSPTLTMRLLIFKPFRSARGPKAARPSNGLRIRAAIRRDWSQAFHRFSILHTISVDSSNYGGRSLRLSIGLGLSRLNPFD